MADESSKRSHGCLFYGGIALVVLLVVVLAAALLGLRYAKRTLNQFTDTQPMPLPAVQLPPAEALKVQRRVDTFRRAVGEHRATEPLELAGDEINALIATDPDLSSLRDKLRVSVEGDTLRSQMSLPMDQLGVGLLKGRYLNGVGTFKVSLQNGKLTLTLQSFTAKGKPLPEAFMARLRRQNLAKNLDNNPRAAAALKALQDIQVKDGKLVIVPKED